MLTSKRLRGVSSWFSSPLLPSVSLCVYRISLYVTEIPGEQYWATEEANRLYARSTIEFEEEDTSTGGLRKRQWDDMGQGGGGEGEMKVEATDAEMSGDTTSSAAPPASSGLASSVPTEAPVRFNTKGKGKKKGIRTRKGGKKGVSSEEYQRGFDPHRAGLWKFQAQRHEDRLACIVNVSTSGR